MEKDAKVKTVLLDGKGNTTVLRESFRTIRTRVTKMQKRME